ncbi:hypothetical protein TNCV_222751 [Trichonephila clavipes]|nr:hypothetical protein TNCV_222751 [Trichonephila clavipes]
MSSKRGTARWRQKNNNLCDVLGKEAVTARACQRCLVKFRFGNFSLKDGPRSGRPSDGRDEVVRSIIRTYPSLSSTEAGFKLGSLQTVLLWITLSGCGSPVVKVSNRS